jgi:hypothetical protein
MRQGREAFRSLQSGAEVKIGVAVPSRSIRLHGMVLNYLSPTAQNSVTVSQEFKSEPSQNRKVKLSP